MMCAVQQLTVSFMQANFYLKSNPQDANNTLDNMEAYTREV